GAAANLGGVYRKEAKVGPTTLGSELRFGAGAGYQVSPIFDVLAEIFGTTEFSSEAGTSPVEAELAARLRPLGSNLVFLAGGGIGVVQAVGSPSARAFAGASFVFEKSDQDGDGISDDKDQCPAATEDFDGYQDADGCPDPDNDGDGIPDAKDKCPNDRETVNGYQDADGCPDDVPDRDNDAIADS